MVGTFTQQHLELRYLESSVCVVIIDVRLRLKLTGKGAEGMTIVVSLTVRPAFQYTHHPLPATVLPSYVF